MRSLIFILSICIPFFLISQEIREKYLREGVVVFFEKLKESETRKYEARQYECEDLVCYYIGKCEAYNETILYLMNECTQRDLFSCKIEAPEILDSPKGMNGASNLGCQQ